MRFISTRPVASQWLSGMPPREVEKAWLRVLNNPRDERDGAYHVFSVRHPIDWFWCELTVKEWQGEDFYDPFDLEPIESVISHWMPDDGVKV